VSCEAATSISFVERGTLLQTLCAVLAVLVPVLPTPRAKLHVALAALQFAPPSRRSPIHSVPVLGANAGAVVLATSPNLTRLNLIDCFEIFDDFPILLFACLHATRFGLLIPLPILKQRPQLRCVQKRRLSSTAAIMIIRIRIRRLFAAAVF